jgi:RNA polymerase sigma-70 factor (sigma-E family)
MKPEAEDRYREFVAGQLQPLLRAAYLLCGHYQTAEDLVQITLVQLYQAWPRVGQHDEPRAYTRRILVNAFISSRRRRWSGEDPVAAPPDSPMPGPDAADGVDDRDWQSRLLRRLPPRQRAVIVLRFWEDLDVTQTAELLGISAGTVKRQTSDALASLRHGLAEHGNAQTLEAPK